MLLCPSDSPLMTASSSKSRFSMTAKFPKALAAAGLAAVLVGCGGGSETARMDNKEDEMDSRVDTQRTAITSAIAASEAAIKKVTTMASQEDVDAADTALAALKTAINAATALSEADRATYTEVYDAHVLLLDGNKAARTAYEDQQDEMQIANENEAWEDAIERYNVNSTVANIDNDLRGTRSLDIGLRNNAVNIQLRNSSNGIPIPSTSMTAPTGMTARRFTIEEDRSRGVIATNFSQAGTQRTYADYFYSTYVPGGTSTVRTGTDLPIADITVSTTTGTITFPNNVDIADAWFGGRPTDIAADTSRTMTFLGVSGTIACGNTACVITSNADGTFSFAGSPIFTPTVPAGNNLNDVILTDIVTDSTEYVAFGYWLNTHGSGSNLRHTIDTYAEAFGYNALTAVVVDGNADRLGRATYSGGALGAYVLDGQGNGEFAADVSLAAQFNDNTGRVPASDQWKITGTIDGFQSATTPGHDLSGWSLGLEADFGDREDDGAISANLGLDGFGITSGGSGEWTAAIYGTNTAISTTDPRLNIEAIVGEFKANFSNGHAVGAFGAERD